ncbi:putative kolobok1-1 nv [Trichonephila clavipes]|nr:putative kolobok1-1 nv [Trichonephila clavipes]
MPRSIESETFAADHVCHSNFQGFALKKLLVLRESSNVLLSNEAFKYAHYYGDGDCKLTDSFIGRLQNYYGIAVRSNVGNLSGPSAKCYCGFVSLLIKCRETDAWAVSHRKKIVGATTSEHKKPNEKYKGLSNEVLNTIKPTYLELCTKELLTKCLHGKTQNSNECLNGVIWQRVPKEVFVCLKIFKIWCIGCCDPI